VGVDVGAGGYVAVAVKVDVDAHDKVNAHDKVDVNAHVVGGGAGRGEGGRADSLT
jgi:hypothetical protein